MEEMWRYLHKDESITDLDSMCKYLPLRHQYRPKTWDWEIFSANQKSNKALNAARYVFKRNFSANCSDVIIPDHPSLAKVAKLIEASQADSPCHDMYKWVVQERVQPLIDLGEIRVFMGDGAVLYMVLTRPLEGQDTDCSCDKLKYVPSLDELEYIHST